MISLFKKVKLEFFYLRRLFNPKYTPSCRFNFRYYGNYFKNKLFGRFLIRQLPKYECSKKSNFEIHILCQKSDITQAVWTLWSFLDNSQLCPKIFIHDDGSLDKNSADILKARFDDVEIISRKEADEMIDRMRDISPIIKAHRNNGHPLILKLIDIFLLSKAEVVMVLDSDVLFFNRPAEIIDFISGKLDYDAIISGISGEADFKIKVSDEYDKKYDLTDRGANLMNSGLIVYKRSAIPLEWLVEYFENCKLGQGDYFIEMTGWCCLIARLRHYILPPEKYIIKGKPQPDTVMKHFTSSRRHEFYAYGIDMAKNSIKQNGK